MLRRVKLAMEPESSLPGSPPGEVLKRDGISGGCDVNEQVGCLIGEIGPVFCAEGRKEKGGGGLREWVSFALKQL